MRIKPGIIRSAEAAGSVLKALGAVISWCVGGCLIAVTVISIILKMEPDPFPGLGGAAASLPSRLYADMLGMEIARLDTEPGDSTLSARNVASFLTKLTTGIDPEDPRTLAARLLPGEQGTSSVILIHGVGTGPADYPVEVPPAAHLRDPVWSGEGSIPPDPAVEQIGRGSAEPPGESVDAAPDSGAIEHPAPPPAEESPAAPVPLPNIVFVYHSHPEESFLPELEEISAIDEAYAKDDKDKTIAAVGKKLSDELEKRGVGAIHSDLYYPWRGAYDESRKTVKTAMAKYEDLTYFIDIHRDAARAEKTKLTVDGVTYARLYFVVGQKNPSYAENQALAEELHYRIEEKIGGLSRGVVGKKDGSNGEFNQSLSPGSLLIEFGGVDNTLEECYRTAEVLAEVLAELHWERSEAVKANAAPEDASGGDAKKVPPSADAPGGSGHPAAG